MRAKTVQILSIALFATLLLWGLYTLLVYVGVPVHQMVLLTEEAQQAVARACPSGGLVCQGMNALIPSITHTFGRALPWLGYAVLSLIALGAMIGWEFMKSGKAKLSVVLTPWKVLLLFILSAWTLFTVLSFGETEGLPYRQYIEPLPQVYVTAGPEALEVLQADYQRLLDRGCLQEVGMTNHNARIYNYRGSCMQMSFITRVMPQLLLIVVLLAEFLILGRLILSVMRLRTKSLLTEATISAGLGAGALIAILWLISLLNAYTALAGWALLIAIPLACFPHTIYWAKKFIGHKWDVELPWYSVTTIIGWLLVSYLAMNFLHVVRPFPIGWDDLGRYINQPRLLVSYGHFIPTLASFQWEYLTSLGFLLFGYDNPVGATSAMMINWSAGVLAVFSVLAFGRRFFGRRGGLLAALLYYTLPLVGHFSFADMKVDNAVFAMGTLSVFTAFLWMFPETDDEDNEADPAHSSIWWMAAAGLLGGVAFALKPTSVMTITSLLAGVLGIVGSWTGFAGGFFLTWALYAKEGRLNPADMLLRSGLNPEMLGRTTLLFICLIIGLAFLALTFVRRRNLLLAGLRGIGIYVLASIVAILPWLMYNNISYGNVVPSLVLTAANSLTPTLSFSNEDVTDFGQTIKRLPPELQIDPDNAACKSTSKSEELDRYWGAGGNWTHYVTLVWRSVMNLDSAGYYVTLMPALLLFPLLLLLPYFWSREGKWLRWLSFSTVLMTMQWVLFANGIAWYGLGMFLGLCLGLEALATRPTLAPKITAGVLIGLSLVMVFAMRFWQHEQQSNIFEYALGKVSADAMRERIIPHYDNIRDTVMARYEGMPQRPYTYRVGTFIPYFIPKNLEVLPLADHQLDTFNCLYQERDAALTLRRLQALGFNGFIFDTNTHTIERDPNGSLHKKVELLVDFLNTPGLGLQIVVNDPGAGIAYVLLP